MNSLKTSQLFERAIKIICSIEKGKVSTYGKIASICGYPRNARQVAFILKHYSKEYHLPWQRIISSSGRISIKDPIGFQMQKEILIEEGVFVSHNGKIDLKEFLA